MNNTKDKGLELAVFFITLVAGCVAYIMYMMRYMQVKTNVYQQIIELLNKSDIIEQKMQIVMYIMYAIVYILTLIVGFVIYKVIFRVTDCRISDIKLMVAIGTAYAVCFLISYFVISSFMYSSVIVISNIVENVIVLFMCYDDIRKKIVPIIFIKIIIVLLNVSISFLM